ncbi:unnamed protein product [Urochloa decumbens]|uniref:Uncharacterized protein n=1 Tax=Urochloa decumbens TaxID=240449 RepID=A0ABC8ZZW5_9POAL
MLGDAATAGSGERHYIHRVPRWIKEMTSSKAYTPSLVSLGPFHHGDPALLPMEAHKQRAVVSLVRRSGKPLREFVDAVGEVAPRLEAAYERLGDDWISSERFVEVMLTDGCFLLELVRAFLLEGEVDEDEYGPDNPVFSKHGYRHLRHVLLSDVLLMENQLPMLLLYKILSILNPSLSYSMDRRVKGKQRTHLLWIQEGRLGSLQEPKAIHPLHYFLTGGDDFPKAVRLVGAACSASFAFRKTLYLPAPDFSLLRKLVNKLLSFCGLGASLQSEDDSESMPTATELHEAGIHFMATVTGYGERRKVEGISFERGILSIPVVHVDDYTEKKYLNLMAFERLEPGAGHDVTDFIFFMDGIIDSAMDVALLRSSGVIVNLLGSDEDVANLFSKVLSKGAALSQDSKLRGVYKDVNAHCRKPWNKWRAIFMQTYLAAVILLVATLVQTVYSVAAFYQG